VGTSTSEPGREHGALAVFADELKAARATAALSQDQLAEKIAYSPSLISMIEKCRRIPTMDFAQRCDEALGTAGNLARLQPLVASELFPSWFRPFAELEKSAVSLRSWESSLVPGLLQVEGYARAVLRAAREADDQAAIDEATAARVERQAILGSDSPPFCWFVMDEAALHRPVGGPAVFAEQLDRLIEAARHPRIKIQVLPFAAGEHAGLSGAFVVASFVSGPDVALLETARTGLVVEAGETVAQCAFAFDSLRADALSPFETIKLLRSEAQKWASI
jgi:transcriptional regulator with XRE-family HTH domain